MSLMTVYVLSLVTSTAVEGKLISQLHVCIKWSAQFYRTLCITRNGTNPESVSKEQQIVQNIGQNIVPRSKKIGNQNFASSQPKKHSRKYIYKESTTKMY